jgi:Mg2+-importing ATPase
MGTRGADRRKAGRRRRAAATESDSFDAYWTLPAGRLISLIRGGPNGLTSGAAARRLKRYGHNALRAKPRASALRLFVRQFQSPLVLILVFAVTVAAIVRDWTDAAIILAIVLGSGILSFVQEHRASTAMEQLRARVRIKTTVIRDGKSSVVPSEMIVPADVVLLSAGNLIPADGVVLEAKDFFVTQSVLTGEPLPVEKQPGVCPADAALAQRTNCVFMGTSVRSGTARVLIVRTGTTTVYGSIADQLRLRPPETEFERGIRRYGYLLTQIMLLLVLIVFAANVFLAKPRVESLLFAIALAVGMSPELLPAIISVTLSKGARDMAARGVIVRRLTAIENLGSMDILCTDKTGTLTEGVIALDGALDPAGKPSDALLRDAYLNASLQTGLANPLDDAIVARASQQAIDISRCRKIDEIPYDFVRKRLSVVVQVMAAGGDPVLIAKGALANILDVCDGLLEGADVVAMDDSRRARIEERFAEWSALGYRVLGVAKKTVASQDRYTREDERSLSFAGFLLFFDPPKPGIREALGSLNKLGVQLKVITGDNRLVAAHLAESVGLQAARMLSGSELNNLRDEALWRVAEQTNLFVDVDPNQKERIILALKKTGHVVGYLGDGINDATALHAADVGISVDKAVDVAKEAADFVLLEHDLDVLRQGIEEGRTTFANTLKYIAITTSANFGNMISMAAASLFLPFLPLLAKQILLNNFLSDFPAMSIASDNVDAEMVERPRRWDIGTIRNFMIVFGLVSSAFDFLTFGVLLYAFNASTELFRTGWFVESLMTELAIALVVRTYKPFYRSRPGRILLLSTLTVMALTLALPYLPIAELLDFVPLPLPLLGALLAITLLYAIASEVAKHAFFHRFL